MKNMKKKIYASDICIRLFLVTMAILSLYPFYYTLIGSFNDGLDFEFGGIWIFVRKFTKANYLVVFSDARLYRAFLNTVSIVIIGTICSIFFTSCVSYAMSQKELKFKGFFRAVNLFTMFFSGGIVPYYKVPEDLDSWIECFDPSSYLSYCSKPILFTMGMNETFFSVKMNALSAKLCKGNVYYSQRKDLTHYHRWKDEEGMSNIYMFMEHVLNNKPLPYKLTSASIEGNELKFSVSDYSKIRMAVLNYTSSDGKDPRDWVWLQKGIVLDNNEKSVLVPLGTKACFVQFTDGETLQFISSSEVFFINK